MEWEHTEIGETDQEVGDDELGGPIEAVVFLLDELEVVLKVCRA